ESLQIHFASSTNCVLRACAWSSCHRESTLNQSRPRCFSPLTALWTAYTSESWRRKRIAVWRGVRFKASTREDDALAIAVRQSKTRHELTIMAAPKSQAFDWRSILRKQPS